MSEEFWDRLKKSREIPALPDLTLKVLSILDDSSKTLQEAVSLIKQDPSLVMRIMKVANSARYGGTMSITALEIAAGRLGVNLLKQITLLDGLTMVFQTNQESHLTDFWRHSLSTACLTEELYKKAKWAAEVRAPNKIECFTAGVIHKMGFLFMLSAFEEEVHSLLDDEALETRSIIALEQERLGVTHEEVSAFLSKKWNLPEGLADVSSYHSKYQECPEEYRSLCALVYLAAYVSRQGDVEGVFKKEFVQLDESVWSYLGIEKMDTDEVDALANKALAFSNEIL